MEKRKTANQIPEGKFTVKFNQIDITENADSAKIELFMNGEVLTFTDYLLLYKFEVGWKIVQKIYYRYPKDEK